MTAPQHTLDPSPEAESTHSDQARKQRLRLIVIAVVFACGVLTLVGGAINLLSP
jgi:hypothetical protein